MPLSTTGSPAMASAADRIQTLLANPDQRIEDADVRMLRRLLKRHPAFSPARTLLARAAAQQNLVSAARLRHRAAAHSRDRRWLARLMAQGPALDASSARTSTDVPLADTTRWHPASPRLSKHFRRHEASQLAKWVAGPVSERPAQQNHPLPVSYDQLLVQEGRLNPVEQASPTTRDVLPRDVIEDFLQKTRKRTARSKNGRNQNRLPEPTEEESRQGEQASTSAGLASETLANIHRKQGRFERALEMYRTLALRQPEKSAYFAGLIKMVEQEKQASEG